MKKMPFAATILLAAILPFATAPAFAETVDTQAAVCVQAQAPSKVAKAAKAGVDCTATSTIPSDKDKAATKYPSGPVNFGNGVVF